MLILFAPSALTFIIASALYIIDNNPFGKPEKVPPELPTAEQIAAHAAYRLALAKFHGISVSDLPDF